ncbi:hypothetical protein [Pedobacter aquatilis]|uniref:hypothetical protein n=1 Tax=Pedobacter aquatilis TaxID=351343 RepID=UPI00292FB9A0|nr:hypothetical protein [Pedobacter aquatilis]
MGRKANVTLPLQVQRDALKSFMGDAEVKVSGDKLTWKGFVKPHPFALQYLLEIVYLKGEYPKIYVLQPELIVKAESLPHVYSVYQQKLCLFFPNGREWRPSKLIVNTILLWACEWLFHYEIWAATDIWNGGGTVH